MKTNTDTIRRGTSLATGCAAALLAATAMAGDPPCTSTELSKLLPGDVAAGDEFGIGAATDGTVAVIGAWRATVESQTQRGCAYVYRNNGGIWGGDGTLVQPDGNAYDRFARSVAVDGDTIVVGAHFDDDGGSKSGSATVYEYVAGTWTWTAKLVASDDATGDEFGWSVAIDGDTIVVGAHLAGGTGAAYVFDRNTGGANAWGQVAKLTASDAASGSAFGQDVDVNGDWIIVGASQHGGAAGAAYLFERPGAGWTDATETDTLLAYDAALGDEFGVSVAVEADRVVVGAFRDDDAGSSTGAVYPFRYSAPEWTAQVKILAPDATSGDYFGYSVGIGGDLLVVGAYLDDDAGTSSGSAYAFRHDGASWTGGAKLAAGDGAASDAFGVAVDAGAGAALVGAFHNGDNGANTGSAYVYRSLTDCDGNGTLDLCDLAGGAEDLDDDGILDVCQVPPCPSDLDGDGTVGFADLLSVLSNWGACGGCPEDLDGDGLVAFADLLAVLSTWGDC